MRVKCDVSAEDLCGSKRFIYLTKKTFQGYIGLDFAKVSFEINQVNAEHCRIYGKNPCCAYNACAMLLALV